MIKGNHKKLHAAFFLLLFFGYSSLFGQEGNKKYPQGYFRNPLGIPMQVTANFGELRSNHWHMGFDLRTDQKENYPVFAAADGYIAHAGIRALSFGKYLVVRHPNGFSTLYAHLNSFSPEVESFVRQKQSELQSWPVEMNFDSTHFKVKKGDTIALSGNTGGSQGPHLHFEIIESTSGRSLNPQLFGLPVMDDVPPFFSKLAIYDRHAGTYLQQPKMIQVVKTDSGYITKPRKIATGSSKISFAIGAADRITGSKGENGIYGSMLYADNEPQVAFILDSMNYQESDYINAHIDRKYKNSNDTYLQHLSRLPGFRGRVYEEISGSGIIDLKDTAIHFISIEIFDTEENIAVLNFQVQYSDSLAKKIKRQAKERLLVPGQVNIIEENEFEAFFPETTIYDSVPVMYSRQEYFPVGSVTARHLFGDPVYPIHNSIYIRLLPSKKITPEFRDKIIMTREWQGKRSIRKAEWQQQWLSAKFDVFGNYQAFIDSVPPQVNTPVTVRLPGKKKSDTLDLSPADKIIFTPTDNFAVKSFRAELDGRWLMFDNDKAVNHVYKFDEQCPFGLHELKVRVEDLAGNITEKSWWFKRLPYTPPPKKRQAGKKPVTKKK
jgi:hypothetical protein